MKKKPGPNGLPNASDIQQVIAEGERRSTLEKQFNAKNAEVGRQQGKLRTMLCSFIDVAQHVNKPTADYIKWYKQLVSSRRAEADRNIDAEIRSVEAWRSPATNSPR
jgi:hypothetical protein